MNNRVFSQDFWNEIKSDSPNVKKIRELIIKAYNKENNSNISNNVDVDSEECKSIIGWLNKMSEDLLPLFLQKKTALLPKLSITISEKASFLSQYNCPICRYSYPVLRIPIRISPISKQASKPKTIAAFNKAIEFRLKQSSSLKVEKFHEKSTRFCVHITFVLANSTKDKDLDNLAKALLDATKKILFNDDDKIDHLSLLKIRRAGEEDYLFINIRESIVNRHEDVIFHTMFHGWAGQKPLNLEDFMQQNQS